MFACRIAFCLSIPTLALAQTSPTPTGQPTTTTAPLAPDRHYDPVPTLRAPVSGGNGATVRASIGYAYTSLSMPSSKRVNLSGASATITADLSSRLGVSVDSSYVRASNVLKTGRHVDVLSYLVGPVFYPTRQARMATFVHALVGGARVTGVTPFNGTENVLGFVNKFSWALGGGVEYQVSRSVAFRGGADYQRTYFFDLNTRIQGQNSFRIISSVVYTLWQHPERRR